MKFQRLTRLAARRLEPGQRLVERGIEFERLPNGDGRYSVAIMVDRVRVHRVVGLESDGVTRTQAEEFVARLRTEAREQRLNLPKGRKVALGFARAATAYLERLQATGGRNLDKKRQHVDQWLAPFFGDKPLSKIETFDLQRYAKQRRAQGAADGTINREYATLSHLLHRAVEWRWLDRLPCKIPRLKESGGRIVYLTPEQIARMLEAAAGDARWEVYPFIMIGLHTGMRRMEILSIRLNDIDLERRVIRIPNAKAGPRDQPIGADLAAYLGGLLTGVAADQIWLFPANSACGHAVSIEQSFRRVVKAAGLDPREVVRHTLRHTAITHLVQSGADLPTVKRISGHKTLQMVERYSHQNGEHLRAAMDRLERRITQELHRDKKRLGE